MGSTVQSFGRRQAEHRYALRTGRHRNQHLQRAWDKYGEAAFLFAVLEVVSGLEETVCQEQVWIGRYREQGVSLYNMSPVSANPTAGLERTPEWCANISRSLRGHPSSERVSETNRRLKTGNQYAAKPYPAFEHRATGKFIPAGRNLRALCRKRGLSPSKMGAVKNSRRRSHKGWELKEK